jgi:hypothetical protein
MTTKEKINTILVLCGILILLIIGVSKDDFYYPSTKSSKKLNGQTESVQVYEPELSTPMFYLVTGSFTKKENAELFGYKMLDMGFKPYLLPLTDGYYRVGIFSSPYKEDAIMYRENLLETQMKMWIIYE